MVQSPLMPHLYPLMLDVSDRLVVIIGGGGVGARKARGLLDAGAKRVRVVSPAVDEQMPDGVERVAERYDVRHLDGATLVFAATADPSVNEMIVRDCRRLNILVNRADADDDARGDFSTPAVLREGAVAITVSAGGSPALAAAIRDELRGNLGSGHIAMADAMQALRPLIRGAQELDVAQRRQVFRDLAAPEAIEVLSAGGTPALKAWLARRYPSLDKHLNRP